MHKLPSMPFTSWKSERLNTGCALVNGGKQRRHPATSPAKWEGP